MTDLCYDTEFIENGRTIELISIGMAWRNETYYAITNDTAVITRAVENEWLRDNVVPSLPVVLSKPGDGVSMAARNYWTWQWDTDHPDFGAVRSRKQIARDVAEIVTGVDSPRLWADYGAFDHVVLSWLWGRMVDHPAGVPMWTHDLRQLWDTMRQPVLPPLDLAQVGSGTSLTVTSPHNALWDALEVHMRLGWLRQLEASEWVSKLAGGAPMGTDQELIDWAREQLAKSGQL